MIILGIETSCDETAASIVQDGRKILSHIIATSQEMHAKTGGIIPENAAREQVKSIIPVIEEALKEGCAWTVDKDTSPPIDAIAVTVGPGLIGSLLVGVETAKTLSALWDKPLIPVNHLVAHIYANWLSEIEDNKLKIENLPAPTLPAIALVVSGGHTDLVLLREHGDMEKIGGTRDDAAGEAFDKTARLLGLPYPGGPSIGIAASRFNGEKQIAKLPRSLIAEDNYDFSFSGLKTHIAREASRYQDLTEVQDAFAWEVQEAITDVLVAKTLKAVKEFNTPTLLLAGGVASNSRLKEKFLAEIEKSNLETDFRVSPPWLCTDNASYIASCAEFNNNPRPWQEIEANPSLTIIDR
jgi:N6-L-threonylcarbamoyladenine synthase